MMRGRVWRLGDNIDTDIIIPARFLNTSKKEELKGYCFFDLLPRFSQDVRPGDIILAGSNFGCGSSREHAPLAIKEAGISVVIARSFARIFYRNSLNIGLPLLELKDEELKVKDGEEIAVDLDEGRITLFPNGLELKAEPITGLARALIQAGGLLNYTKQRIQRGEFKE